MEISFCFEFYQNIIFSSLDIFLESLPLFRVVYTNSYNHPSVFKELTTEHYMQKKKNDLGYSVLSGSLHIVI